MEMVKVVATIKKALNPVEIILNKKVAPVIRMVINVTVTRMVRNVLVTKTVKNAPVIRMVRNALVTKMVRNLAAANTRIVQNPAVTTILLRRNNLSFF